MSLMKLYMKKTFKKTFNSILSNTTGQFLNYPFSQSTLYFTSFFESYIFMSNTYPLVKSFLVYILMLYFVGFIGKYFLREVPLNTRLNWSLDIAFRWPSYQLNHCLIKRYSTVAHDCTL